ncbi:hypothetical protein A6301_16710 [Pectobacterium sp. IFB5596]|nr:hypothetical protein [Pectobacterium sp. IFB5596]
MLNHKNKNALKTGHYMNDLSDTKITRLDLNVELWPISIDFIEFYLTRLFIMYTCMYTENERYNGNAT